MKKWLSTLSIMTLIFVLGACNNDSESEEDTQNAEAPQEEDAAAENGEEAMEMPEPDLEGIPEVVAEVNGEEITQEDFTQTYESQFQQTAMQQQMMGGGEEINQDELKQQVADMLVNQELLAQEAENRDFTAGEDEVNEMVDQMLEQNGMENRDELFAALDEQGLPEDEVMNLLETQIKVDQLIEDESGEIEPTDEELQEMYDQMQEQQGQTEGEEEPPSFEELKPQLEQQFVMQKQGEATQALIEQLKEDADTTIHL
ncbi:SurA N-terminal domain-containing protein [Corticicoccus populi]|uniref:peptidylprolyl isomerase n=1 Tax=Corticicoccus populi TaxID=1812821 RepID=A0ABW5WVR8_9STAP